MSAPATPEPASFPARLHVLLARDAPIGVVLRRGPSKQACAILWNRDDDSFRTGQWIKGRIYERRADLSPDGRLMIYFAMNGRWSSETGGSWTAISQPPWLKAIALYAKGDCWEGGGLFLDRRRYWLNDRYFNPTKTRLQSSLVTRDEAYSPPQQFGAECTSVYYPRLLRDGWTLVERRKFAQWDEIAVFDKPLAKGWWLRKLAHEQIGAPPGRGCYWDEHELHGPDGVIAQPDWEWADLDGSDLVWTQRGRLHRARFDARGMRGEGRVLHDFNAMTFEPVAAPY
jgi:hypothetical protein